MSFDYTEKQKAAMAKMSNFNKLRFDPRTRSLDIDASYGGPIKMNLWILHGHTEFFMGADLEEISRRALKWMKQKLPRKADRQ